MPITATAPGKLILLGEYAVLEGAPALAAAVDRFSKVTFTPHTSEDFLLDSPILNLKSLPFSVNYSGKLSFGAHLSQATLEKLVFFITTFEQGWRLFGGRKNLAPMHIMIDTGDFFGKNMEKMGFGSSASLTVALLGALEAYAQKSNLIENQPYQFFRAALKAHHLAQGKLGSGIDVAASVFGGVLQYQIIPDAAGLSPIIEETGFHQNLYMVVVWTGKSASTPTLVNQVLRFRESDKTAYQKIMDEMNEISFTGCHAMFNQETSAFIDAIQSYHNALAKLGQLSGAPIVSPEHRAIAKITCNCGGVYKPSGAGGGDIGLAFANSPEIIETVGTNLENAGYQLIPLKISGDGLRNEQVDD